MSERALLNAAIASELEACTCRVRALLEQATSLSEREVMSAGERIASIHHEAMGNVASLERVGRQFDATAGRATLEAAMDRNAAMMQGYTRRLADGMVRQRACTASVTEVARKITAFVAGVERVSVALKMLTLNARLEASRWGNQGAAFATVAASMRDLTGEVSKANENIGGLASELSIIAERVADSEKVMEDLSMGLAGDVETEMSALSGAYETTRRASADAVAEGVERGRRLVELANSLLTNLQFQDRMTQVLREAGEVVARGEAVAGELLANVPEGAGPTEVQAAIDAVLARAGNAVVRMSGESELSSSDAGREAGAVELF